MALTFFIFPSSTRAWFLQAFRRDLEALPEPVCPAAASATASWTGNERRPGPVGTLRCLDLDDLLVDKLFKRKYPSQKKVGAPHNTESQNTTFEPTGDM